MVSPCSLSLCSMPSGQPPAARPARQQPGRLSARSSHCCFEGRAQRRVVIRQLLHQLVLALAPATTFLRDDLAWLASPWQQEPALRSSDCRWRSELPDIPGLWRDPAARPAAAGASAGSITPHPAKPFPRLRSRLAPVPARTGLFGTAGLDRLGSSESWDCNFGSRRPAPSSGRGSRLSGPHLK